MTEHSGPPRPEDRGAAEQPKQVDFQTLAGSSKEVLIQHAGQIYRLRLTKNGKLILNK